jgi:pimeloyl-ACP methyl ester carboxylesterase
MTESPDTTQAAAAVADVAAHAAAPDTAAADAQTAPPGEEFTVPVAGGELAVLHWLGDPEQGAESAVPVVAVHGITSNGQVWVPLARQLPGHRIYAPDLRGRGRSRDLPEPYGMAAHVADLLALLDHIAETGPAGGDGRVVLVGHSMGGFVATLAAARHPERFAKVVLVDGGLGITAPPGDIDTQLDLVIGPAIRRLSMTFPDTEAYRDFYRQHPGYAAYWGPDVQRFVDRDLIGTPPGMRSSCVHDAIRTDGADVLSNPEITGAVREVTVPIELLYAERGLMDEPQALYDALVETSPVPVRLVPDTNHYSILLTGTAARAMAEAVRT